MNWRILIGMILITWGVLTSVDDILHLVVSLIPAGAGAGLLAWDRAHQD